MCAILFRSGKRPSKGAKMANNLIPSSRETALSPERTRAILARYGVHHVSLWKEDGTLRFPTWGDLATFLGY